MEKGAFIQKDKLEYSRLSRFDTPFYFYDLDKVESNISNLKKSINLDDLEIFYSVKTNDHPVLLQFLKENGLYAEVVSGLELELARKIGFKKICFNGPAKTVDEIKLAAKKDDVTIIADNLRELKVLQEFSSNRIEIGLRLDLSDIGYHKFGLNKKDTGTALEIISRDRNLVLTGLHFHVGSFIQKVKYYEIIFKKFLSFIKSFPLSYYNDLRFLNIGGGVPCKGKVKRTLLERALEYYSYRHSVIDRIMFKKEQKYLKKIESFNPGDYLSEYSVIVEQNISKLEALLEKRISLYIEPGTAVVGDAVDVYSGTVVNKNRNILIDAGRDIERGSNFYWHPIYNISNPSQEIQREYIFGPICAPNDMFARYYIGRPLKDGDRVKISGMGAYTFSFHSSFITTQLAVVVKKGDGVEKVTDAEKFSDKYRLDLNNRI